jgi:ribosomal protein S24E
MHSTSFCRIYNNHPNFTLIEEHHLHRTKEQQKKNDRQKGRDEMGVRVT